MLQRVAHGTAAPAVPFRVIPIPAQNLVPRMVQTVQASPRPFKLSLQQQQLAVPSLSFPLL